MKLVFLGAPGAGKGTQAQIVCEKLNLPAISTGNILREAVRNGTPTGLKAKEFMDAGKLVPDRVIFGILDERLSAPDCENGFILDGVPRTIAQAEELEAAGIRFDVVLAIEISDGEIIERVSGRRTCPACGATYHVASAPPKAEGVCDNCGGALVQRGDDMPEKVLERLRVYHEETEPLKGFYEARGLLRMVANQPTIEETTRVVLEALGIAAEERETVLSSIPAHKNPPQAEV